MLKKILTGILLLFGIGRRKKAAPVPAEGKPAPGTAGELKADAVVVIKEERIVLVVDQDFKDIPGWVEWDVGMNKLCITQKGGASATLSSLVPANEIERFRHLSRILLIARYNGRRIVHYLAFVVRE